MAAKLTNGQKAYLAQLAKRAYDRLGSEARASQTVDEYRHAQVAAAVGKAGLTLCSQDDYKRVEAHFLNLLDETGKALNAHMRAETEQRRVISWKIVKRCREYGVPLSKAEGICRQMTKGVRGLDEATDIQLWNVYFKLDHYRPQPGQNRLPKPAAPAPASVPAVPDCTEIFELSEPQP